MGKCSVFSLSQPVYKENRSTDSLICQCSSSLLGFLRFFLCLSLLSSLQSDALHTAFPSPEREREGESKKRSRYSGKMVISRVPFGAFLLVFLLFGLVLPSIQAQSLAPAPPPTSDGTSVDQGIAYLLMLVALIVTYLIHPMDASTPYKLF